MLFFRFAVRLIYLAVPPPPLP